MDKNTEPTQQTLSERLRGAINALTSANIEARRSGFDPDSASKLNGARDLVDALLSELETRPAVASAAVVEAQQALIVALDRWAEVCAYYRTEGRTVVSFPSGAFNAHDLFTALSELANKSGLLKGARMVADMQHDDARAILEAAGVRGAVTEFAWVCERGEASHPEYLQCTATGFEWTRENGKALRFSRRADADRVSMLIEDVERVAEHGWTEAAGDAR